ncbi:nucleolar protein 6 [Etheostoma cragini]|uniref:nucleolar protein 6 n=1 Tax=Etheostoma cragini TaxID=417921 RepID=UPI00155E8EBA|nr:nucleolar protein 6 [Etheostoma cragini]
MKKKQATEDPAEMIPTESHEEENEAPVKAKRSKTEEAGGEEAVYHPAKLSRSDLYRPPTAEELNQLKEAESLFHCSLLKMQMEELLKEVALSERRKQKIDSFIQTVTKLLQTVPESPEVEVSDLSWLSSAVKVPFLLVPKTTKGKFHMTPPASVDLIGSYPLGTCTKPHVMVDLAVTIPADVLHPKDVLNQRYPRKRALYLAGLAQCLASSSDIGSMLYSCLHGNRLRPVLLLTPPGKDSSSFTVRVHACPPPGFFKPSRFHPQRNNIRTEWYTGLQTSQSESSESPTPHYNSSVLGDLLARAHLQFLSAVSSQCSAFADGVALLKVWLRQRELHQGTGCFNGFLASMLLAYLLTSHRISNSMTAYQLLRNTLNFLASTDLTVNGISLAKDPDSTAPSLAEFHNAFQVVFVDPSGHLNMCADMTACTYKQLQHEASVSMQFWDDPTLDGFHSLLMTPKPMIRTSDHIFQLCDLVKLQSSCKKLNLLSELMDHSGNYVHTALPYILSLLQRGLGQRIHLLTHSLSPDPEWSVASEAPKHKAQPPLSFGVLLKPELAASALERGPPADSPKAAEFRQLWGSRSELRRFQDGAITEAVLWDGETMCQKRLVPRQIITHLLQLHADIPESSMRYVGAMADDVIKTGSELPSTGEEESLLVVQSYDDLSRKLWRLEGLPLSITAVQGAHPALRYTQVFPPLPLKLDYSFFDREKTSRSLVPKEGKPCPAYITPITVICHMEGSGKWPHDRLAIRHIRTAFHIRLGELLKKHHNYTCRPCPTHLDVWKDGLVFRLQVAYHREPHVLRESVNAEGLLVVRDNEEAQALEMATIHKPLLTSTLHGLQQQHPCFGAVCRLAKRWLGAQLFSDDITEDTADLLVALLFLQPAPFTPPGSPQVGFLRFLHLLSSFDWRNNPLVVNLNNQLAATDYTEIKNDFTATRESLPVMFIATPKDKKQSIWTKRAPSVQMLQRVVMVAAESLKLLENQLMDSNQIQDVRVVMRPPLDAYDVLIHLNPKQVPLLVQAVDPPTVTFSRGLMAGNVAQSGGALPVIDYNPVSLYMAELREAFGNLALFFCDPYGGTVIAVLWKPKAFTPMPFKTSQVSARSVVVSGEEANTVPNIEAILEDFRIMGKGLIKSLEARTEKWSL